MNVKKFAIFGIFGIIIAVIVGVGLFFAFQQKPTREKTPEITTISNMKIQSLAFAHNENIPSKYTCDGENVSPPLSISDIPEGAQSLALIVDDPDAPVGTFVHWTVWNIDPATSQIAEGAILEGVSQGMTDFGSTGYGGPCPPTGVHRYFFKLAALDTKLELSESARKSDIEKAMEGHIIDRAELIGLYSRQR